MNNNFINLGAAFLILFSLTGCVKETTQYSPMPSPSPSTVAIVDLENYVLTGVSSGDGAFWGNFLQDSARRASSFSLENYENEHNTHANLFYAPDHYYQNLDNPDNLIEVSSVFGMRSGRMHNGLDIRAPEGTPIVSYSAGEVVRAESHYSFGLVVEVLNSDGTLARYAHMVEMGVALGDKVIAGSVLGYVGRTGRTTGNHLHLEILEDGRNIDPQTIITSTEMVIQHSDAETTSDDSQIALN